MPKYICKVSRHMGQFRITIPKALVSSVQWGDVDYVIIKEFTLDALTVRRFDDGESLKSNHADDRTRSD